VCLRRFCNNTYFLTCINVAFLFSVILNQSVYFAFPDMGFIDCIDVILAVAQSVDWLQAGRPSSWNVVPVKEKNVPFSI
jgi:hypothetical protein